MKIGWRIWVMIIAILLSLLAIHPSFNSGAVVKYVASNSPLYVEGLRSGEIVKSVNGQIVNDKDDYLAIIKDLQFSSEGSKFSLETDVKTHVLLLNSTPDITVENIPRTRIQTGLDLRGGARALVQPNATLTDAELDDLIAISINRFNVFGISDIQIRSVNDLSGNKFMLVEVAGATPDDLENLVSKQGKFEAKVGNVTLFEGGKNDIADVCRNRAECAGITQCFPNAGGYACNFAFTVYLTESAAKKHAIETDKLGYDSTGQYLSEKLYLYVDDIEVDSLLISSGLKGQETTQISIQGSGSGATQEAAFEDARSNMNKLQTILLTGGLPYKLNIVKLDTISPTLGDQFIKTSLLAGFAAIVGVGIIVFIRYRKIKESLAVLFTSFSEIIIILGVASLIHWNLDLPSIAGILATIGTGVDQQIVILDEARRGKITSMKEKMKHAIFIVMSAYATVFVSMIPLYWAGAGLFKGFALTTIVGITAGVLISRPAFAEIIKNIEGD
jgi:preprotein translocase subunit SecD